MTPSAFKECDESLKAKYNHVIENTWVDPTKSFSFFGVVAFPASQASLASAFSVEEFYPARQPESRNRRTEIRHQRSEARGEGSKKSHNTFIRALVNEKKVLLSTPPIQFVFRISVHSTAVMSFFRIQLQ